MTDPLSNPSLTESANSSDDFHEYDTVQKNSASSGEKSTCGPIILSVGLSVLLQNPGNKLHFIDGACYVTVTHSNILTLIHSECSH